MLSRLMRVSSNPFRGYVSEEEIRIKESIKEREEKKFLEDRIFLERLNPSFSEVKPSETLGSGVYGTAFRCELRNEKFVCKVFKPQENSSPRIFEQDSERESLFDSKYRRYLRYNSNVTTQIFHKKEDIIEFSKLPGGNELKEEFDHLNLGDYYKSGFIIMQDCVMDLETFVNQRVNEGVEFSNDEICHILEGILSGIQYINSQGIIHMDLHNGNVFVDPSNGRVWVADFGNALNFNQEEGNTEFYLRKFDDQRRLSVLYKQIVSFSGTYFRIRGCSSQLAPEIVSFVDRNSDLETVDLRKSDVYSVGLLGFYLVTAFCGEGVDRGDRNNWNCSEKVKTLIGKMMERNVSNRIHLKQALEELQKGRMLEEVEKIKRLEEKAKRIREMNEKRALEVEYQGKVKILEGVSNYVEGKRNVSPFRLGSGKRMKRNHHRDKIHDYGHVVYREVKKMVTGFTDILRVVDLEVKGLVSNEDRDVVLNNVLNGFTRISDACKAEVERLQGEIEKILQQLRGLEEEEEEDEDEDEDEGEFEEDSEV